MRHPAPRPALGSAFLLLALACGVGGAAAAQTGTVAGTVSEAETGTPLPGANVRVEGTTIGATTDANGRFQVTGVPAGRPTLVASFLGFAPDSATVALAPGGRVSVDFVLGYVVVGGEEVVVTAQAAGQAAAINQQISSNTIVNVVSADRIQEVPDANAAESIGRLPGVSVQRDAGEGQKVVIRGLSPQFSNVTVNGQRVPATDVDNRSVDLSTISQDVLAGIEVYKALTPDQDGDAIAGAVNLTTQTARAGFRGRFSAEGGYNGLVDAPGQYKLGALLSDRVFGGRLGGIVTGSFFRARRDSEQLNASYEDELLLDPADPTAPPDLEAREVVAGLREEVRDRYSFGADLDLDLGRGGALFYNTLYARTDRDEDRYRLEAIKSLGNVGDDVRFTERSVDVVTNNLRGEHVLFGRAELSWRASHAASINRTPRQLFVSFLEGGGLDAEKLRVADDTRNPLDVLRAVENDYRNKGLSFLTLTESRTLERDLVGQVDLQVPFSAGFVSGYLKTGGKLRDKFRRRTGSQRGNFANDLTRAINSASAAPYRLTPFGLLSVNNFRDCTGEPPNQTCLTGRPDFLDTGIPGPLVLNADAINVLFDALDESGQVLGVSSFAGRNYEVDEEVAAAYVMTEVQLGPRVMVLPGVRFEQADGTYNATLVSNGSAIPNGSGQFADTTAAQSYGLWLPMLHLRVRPTDAFDLRFAATRTLARPDFGNLVPFRFVGNSVQRGDATLRPAVSWGYDLFATLYTSTYGLVSAGGFYKTISDIEYLRTGTIFDPLSPFNLRTVTEPVNADGDTDVYGFEVEVQTALSYLPAPFDGLVFNANYARTFSETVYPFFDVVTEVNEFGDEVPVIDPETGLPTPFFGERTGPAPGQSDHIANAALGYERGGFSGRVSLTYQSPYLAAVASNAARDAFTDSFTRWDVSARQRLVGGASVLLNLVNVTSLPERSFTGLAGRPSNEEYFGWSATLGLRYDL